MFQGLSFLVSIYSLNPAGVRTLPETNSSPLNIGYPKKKFHLPTTDFQVQAVSFRECNIKIPMSS